MECINKEYGYSKEKKCLNDSCMGNNKKGICIDKGWENIKNCEGRIIQINYEEKLQTQPLQKKIMEY